jgi:hypothetical protein
VDRRLGYRLRPGIVGRLWRLETDGKDEIADGKLDSLMCRGVEPELDGSRFVEMKPGYKVVLLELLAGEERHVDSGETVGYIFGG